MRAASLTVTLCGVSATARAVPLPAVTVTLLSTMPGASTKSSLEGSSGLRSTRTRRAAAVKPAALTLNWYGPGARPVSSYWPPASVRAASVRPLAMFRARTSAPTTTAPC